MRYFRIFDALDPIMDHSAICYLGWCRCTEPQLSSNDVWAIPDNVLEHIKTVDVTDLSQVPDDVLDHMRNLVVDETPRKYNYKFEL